MKTCNCGYAFTDKSTACLKCGNTLDTKEYDGYSVKVLRTENASLKQDLEQLHKDAVELADLWKQLEPSMKFREVMNKLGYVDAACETAERILKGGGDE